ncbi:putative nuclease HARBI1 [Patiria miniata]|uniref:DDE Tnp4 domain-containing protein n=1 Tax=Patiria miniata TaxID=46514 RepID=A0A914ARX5_PATMI|nr:putative nuclease HARBI1 [Patiria miniata]
MICRSNAISPYMQTLATLRFLATGSFYTVHGDLHDVSVPSVCRIVQRVVAALSRLAPAEVRFPVRPQDVALTKHEFFQLAGFPNVVGALDCTHVRLYGAPLGENEHLYVNRKGYHSINVQAICDANYRITNIVARSYCMLSSTGASSERGLTMEELVINDTTTGFILFRLNGVLVGDTGYALRPWLMTPILAPTTNAERHYNRSHRKARVTVGQTFGQLKRNIPCLSLGMRVSPQRACIIIRACCVLFNLSKEFRQPELDDTDDLEADDDDDDLPYDGPIQDGCIQRDLLVNTYF